jgi:biopolymer transport protein TolR
MMADINVVPYFDVMLVLLVVFMVTAPLLTQGIKVELPSASGDPIEQQQEPVVLSVDAQGQYFVNLSDDKTPKTLEEIGNIVTSVRLQKPNVPLFLEGDQGASYGSIATMLGYMQSIGVNDVSLVTDPTPKPLKPAKG